MHKSNIEHSTILQQVNETEILKLRNFYENERAPIDRLIN